MWPGYVMAAWSLAGFVNSCCYLSAPQLVNVRLKATAAGLLAVSYQAAHLVGLGIAVCVAAAFFGGVVPA